MRRNRDLELGQGIFGLVDVLIPGIRTFIDNSKRKLVVVGTINVSPVVRNDRTELHIIYLK
jgi:hypothetical protein